MTVGERRARGAGEIRANCCQESEAVRAEMAQQFCTNPSILAKVEPTIRFISVNSVEQSLLPDGCKRARSAKGRHGRG